MTQDEVVKELQTLRKVVKEVIEAIQCMPIGLYVSKRLNVAVQSLELVVDAKPDASDDGKTGRFSRLEPDA